MCCGHKRAQITHPNFHLFRLYSYYVDRFTRIVESDVVSFFAIKVEVMEKSKFLRDFDIVGLAAMEISTENDSSKSFV